MQMYGVVRTGDRALGMQKIGAVPNRDTHPMVVEQVADSAIEFLRVVSCQPYSFWQAIEAGNSRIGPRLISSTYHTDRLSWFEMPLWRAREPVT
jgi:hypothetical protein